MKTLRFFLFSAISLLSTAAVAQVGRIQDYNTIGWFVYQGDHRLTSKWELRTEAQVRRVGLVTDWQQLLLRTGVAYQVLPRFKVRVGAAYASTHRYGEHPIADGGTYPERRLFADLELSDQVGYFLLNQRLRLDQRWIGLPGANVFATTVDDDSWRHRNRLRYQLQLTVPLQGPTLDDREWYLSGFEEVFINFGRDITTNVFDQNRLAAGVGYRFDKDFRLEAQYIQQIWQHGALDRRTGFPVYEFNNGLRLAMIYNLDFTPAAER